MANSVTTHPAQKLKIKSLRGNYFKLVVNVKTSAVADYTFIHGTDYWDIDNGFFQVFDSSGVAIVNHYVASLQDSIDYPSDPYTITPLPFAVVVEDGKLTITSDSESGFWPDPGTYKYSLLTQSVLSATTGQLSYWLYGDFVVADDNPSSDFGGAPSGTGLGG